MIPAGVPGRDDIDHQPTYDPEAARQLLADAGFPDGAGFPPVTLATYGVGYEQTVAAELEHNLGVKVNVEAQDFATTSTRHARTLVRRASGRCVERRLPPPARLPGPAARDGQHQQRRAPGATPTTTR